MPQNQQDIAFLVSNISESDTVLKLLMSLERELETLGLFAYRNWDAGELVDGPKVSRYWVETTWMYPRSMMPDPRGGLRLIEHRQCVVLFAEDVLLQPQRVLRSSDTVPDTDQPRKAKISRLPVWLVTIRMPRRYVDQSRQDIFDLEGTEVDVEHIEAALNKGQPPEPEPTEPTEPVSDSSDTDSMDDIFGDI